MGNVAVFVDCGYLFTQGSVAISGTKIERQKLSLNAPAIIEELKKLASKKASGCRLLRIYWYDGLVSSSLSSEQSRLAGLGDVKLRLGFVNSAGQQKGVDSLIVTDLIELARLQSISDAILLAGDEDLRIGVQISQSYGVRVHLLGIVPSRGSQSLQLMREADTTTELSKEWASNCLTIVNNERLEGVGSQVDAIQYPVIFAESISDHIQSLTVNDLEYLKVYWQKANDVPPEYDKRMLGILRTRLGRDLERLELKEMRRQFKQDAKARAVSSST